MAKLTKKSIAAARKKVSPGQWQKRGLKTAWAIQKRGQKGGKRKSPAKKAPARKRSRSVAKSNPNNNRSPKIGASIQAFKGAQAVASPFVEAGLLRGRNTEALANDLKAKFSNLDTYGGLVIEGINQAVDRKFAHGGALSRGSVSAWAAEGFAALTAFDAGKGMPGKEAAKAANISLSRTIRAYDPQGAGSIDTGDPKFRTYQLLKVGGGALRRISNKGPFKKIFAPAKKLLGEMGGAL